MPEPTGLRVPVRWLGHATVLVELPGLRLLTDPLLRRRLGPLRRHGPVPDPAAIPPLDLVVISHAHPDHLDRWSLRLLPGNPVVAVPAGLGRRVAAARRWSRVVELDVGQSTTVAGWRLTAVEARHWRWPVPGEGLAVGWLLEGACGVWFAGDTSAFPAMAGLRGRVDLALVPVGRWGPQPTPGHLSPRSAAWVAATVVPQVALPIHWGTFYPAGLERVLGGPLNGPGPRFVAEVARLAPDVAVALLAPGEGGTVTLARPSVRSDSRPGAPS